MQLFDNYLFPGSSVSPSHPIVARVPVMHEQTRQELYALLCLLSKRNDNYLKMVARLDGMILPGWDPHPVVLQKNLLIY